jgi:hypothetical protein
MRLCSVLLPLVCALCLYAQNTEDPEITRARAEIERLRRLVDAGAIPRMQLEKAETAMADAQDAAFLRKTIYGQDLTPEQADEMIAAAERRFDRRKQAFDEARKLVEAGVQPQLSLTASMDDLELARKEMDLAESRARLTRELAEMARAEEASQQSSEPHELMDRYEGDGAFTAIDFNRIESAFATRFGKPIPVSAMGETAVHRALGFDHRGRVDVAIYPDAPEGVWLRDYLTQNHIPYFAFRHAVPGKATGAHIHIGPMSTRLKLGG